VKYGAGREKRSKQTGQPYWVYKLNALPRPITVSPAIIEPTEELADISDVARDFAGFLTRELAVELLTHLNLPVEATDVLARFGIGWRPGSRKRSRARRWRTPDGWTFPERDAAGRVIGLHVRGRDGRKLQREDTGRGIVTPGGWRDLAVQLGYVLLVEGASDTLALTVAGQPAIGRPSCNGGVRHLAGLLASLPESVRVIVVGENDHKPLTGRWPGRAGAYSTARDLASMLNRSVWWGVVPGTYRERIGNGRSYVTVPFKDSRDWLIAAANGNGTAERWQKNGRQFAEDLHSGLDRCDPVGVAQPVPAAEMKCETPYRTQLEGRPDTTAAGGFASIEARCRRWCVGDCDTCHVWQRNRHRKANWLTLTMTAAPEHYSPIDDLPDPRGPDTSLAGPWPLYMAVLTDKQVRSVENQLSKQNSRHSRRVYNIRKIALSAEAAEASIRGWITVCPLKNKEQTAIQLLKAGAYLVVTAVNPVVHPPRALHKVSVPDAIALTDQAIIDAPTAPEADADQSDTRLRPVTASPDWRPAEPEHRSNKWKKGRSQIMTVARVARLARLCHLAVPGRIEGVQASALWGGDPLGAELLSVMVEDAHPATTDDQFVERWAAWLETLSRTRLGPAVWSAVRPRLRRLPWSVDDVVIAEGVERDRRDAEDRDAKERVAAAAADLQPPPGSWRIAPVVSLIEAGRRMVRRIATVIKDRPRRGAAIRRAQTLVCRRIEQRLYESTDFGAMFQVPEAQAAARAAMWHRDQDARRKTWTRYETSNPEAKNVSLRLYLNH
jgi:hypothetical protein